MQNPITRILSSLLAIILALILVIIILPFALLFALIAILFSCFVIVRSRRRLPKGTIEILPPEEEPEVKSTTDVELEITVESLQQKGKGSPLEPKKPSGPS